MGWFGINNSSDSQKQQSVPTTPILLEIVSARNLHLTHTKTLLDQEVDPYCIVRLKSNNNNNSDETPIHTTTTIYNDADPIWTIATKSTCLLEIPIVVDESNNGSEKDDEPSLETKENDANAIDEDAVVVEVCHGLQCLGVVTLSLQTLLKGNGERIEYPVLAVDDDKTNNNENENKDQGGVRPMLALRYRKATMEELHYFGKAPSSLLEETTTSRSLSPRNMPPKATEASDINLSNIQEKKMLQSYTKRDKDNVVKYRVQPYPDPASPETTEWMTQEQVYQTALQPSTKWVEAGSSGEVGKVYVEVIACNDLPNLDMAAGDYTDPFVGIVFEDTMVRTDVIHDALDPRWMPWCTRAYCFHVTHPSSLLLIGVFDYDAATEHDPIGRVVINTANFQSNTEYLLHYALHHEANQSDDRGTIMIRLRVEWKGESKARKLAFKLPPRFLINVDNQRAFDVLRYLCRGKVNMEQASIESVKCYANELMSYGLVYCYLVDVAIGVLLWRGRTNLWLGCTTLNIWFPIHSVALLTAVAAAIEMPQMIPAILFFGVAYMLLTVNYYGSRYPYPWNRCKSWHETNMVLLLGRSVHPPIVIEPDTGVDEAEALENLDMVKAQRVSSFLWDAKTVGLKVKKVYSKTSVKSYAIDTKEEEGWFTGSLTYVHMALMYMCTYLRLVRNLVNWRGYYTHKLTLWCLMLGFAWVFLPMNTVVQWTCRVIAWTFLGPWMKIVDILYIHPHYRTTEEILEDPTVKDTGLEKVLTSESVKNMGASARIASEEALKLKDMREEQFGKLSQLVPPVDVSRYPSIPLPDSTARPYEASAPCQREEKWERASGQNLEEKSMLPIPKKPADGEVLFEM